MHRATGPVMEKQKEQFAQRTRWLFENHVEFLSTHRGSVTQLQDAFTIESDRSEFTYAVLGKGADHALLERFTTVHLIPWSESWDQQPNDSRFQSLGRLSYMTLDGDTSSWKINPKLIVRRVQNEREMDVFSHGQASGFAGKPADYDRWHPWLRSANHRNIKSNNQSFYVGHLDGKAVGTALLVLTSGLGGIYAVTTLPEYRKQGIGSSLMARAIIDALTQNHDQITLQVAGGSYAETLYEKLGFVTQFQAKVFSR